MGHAELYGVTGAALGHSHLARLSMAGSQATPTGTRSVPTNRKFTCNKRLSTPGRTWRPQRRPGHGPGAFRRLQAPVPLLPLPLGREPTPRRTHTPQRAPDRVGMPSQRGGALAAAPDPDRGVA
eukprot:359709-Chlamydomonas_euryale.AAC.2